MALYIFFAVFFFCEIRKQDFSVFSKLLSAGSIGFHGLALIGLVREHELLFVLFQECRRSLHIHEQVVDFTNVFLVNFCGFALLRDQISRGDQVDGISERALLANLGEQFLRCLSQLDILLLTPNLQNLTNLFVIVWLGRNDERTIEQIDGQPVGRFVLGAANLRNSSVRRHDHNWGLITFQGSIQEGEALNIEHVNFVDEKDTRHNFGSAFLTPLSHLLIDLLPHLGLNLANVTSEESHEALRARINHIDLVERHRVHDLLSLLELAFRTLHKTSLRSNIVIV